MHRGEIWLIDYDDPAPPGEPARTRPAVIVSSDRFNATRARTVVAVPLTTTPRDHPLHVEIDDRGLGEVSYAQVELVGVISRQRLRARIATVDIVELDRVDTLLRLLLDR